VATYNAGENVPVRFEGSARHGGVRYAYVENTSCWLSRESASFPCHMTMDRTLWSFKKLMVAVLTVRLRTGNATFG
jgi:hypothetical protein